MNTHSMVRAGDRNLVGRGARVWIWPQAARVGGVMLGLMLWLLVCGGCATPEVTAYRVTGTVGVTVDSAMQAWADWQVQYPDAEVEARVREIYGRYQEAARVARAAALAYKLAPTETNWEKVSAALGAVSAAASEVIVVVNGRRGTE